MNRLKPWVAGVGLCVMSMEAAALHTISLDFESAAAGISFTGSVARLDSVTLGGQYFDQLPYSNDGFDSIKQRPFDTDDGTVTSLASANAAPGVPVATLGFDTSYLTLNGLTGFTKFSFEYSASAFTQVMAFKGEGQNAVPVLVADLGFQPTIDGFIGLAGEGLCGNERAVDLCNWTTRSFTLSGAATSLQFYSTALPGAALYDNFKFTMEHSAMVPEPSTYALMALGLAGIAMISRRRRES